MISQETRATTLQSEVKRKNRAGKWTEDEHSRFLFATRTYGKDWNKITEHVATRSKANIACHFFQFKIKAKNNKNSKMEDLDIIEILDIKKRK